MTSLLAWEWIEAGLADTRRLNLSDGNTGQVVEAIVVKEVKPVVIIIHDGKTSGVVLVAEDPDRKYTKGGQGLQVIKNEFCKMIPWCSEGTLF